MGPMLAGVVDFVIGVDTHRDTHTAAVVNAVTGGVIDQITIPTDAFGYRRLRSFADQHAPGTRVWAIEGTGSYGSGITTSLLEHGEWVVEIDRPSRPARCRPAPAPSRGPATALMGRDNVSPTALGRPAILKEKIGIRRIRESKSYK